MAQLNTDSDVDRNRSKDPFLFSLLNDTPARTIEVVEETAVNQVRSGSTFELVASIVGAGFAILGLAGVMSLAMASLATIAVGFALLANGVSMSLWRQRSMRSNWHDRSETVGVSSEVAGGLATIVLGVLSLITDNGIHLMPVAAIVIGASVLLGGPAQSHLASIVRPHRHDEGTQGMIWASGGAMAMAGGAALGLGIFALVQDVYVGTTLVAMLAVGVALAMAGGALVSRLARRFA